MPQFLAILCLIWVVSEVCLTRRSRPGATSKDSGSEIVLRLVVLVSLGCGLVAAHRFHAFRLPARNVFYMVGVFVFVAGMVLRIYSIIHLGRFFTLKVAIATDHRLIESGPYRFIRHPSYTGLLMMFFGIGLGIGDWLSVLVIIIPVFTALRWRIRIEEAALLEALGDSYRCYTKRARRLVPMIY
jgi:protein-S-isoprenylcysteine O-methyltransferase